MCSELEAPVTTLSKDEYLATFVEPMRRLAENEPYKPVNLGKYVDDCIRVHDPLITREQLVIQSIEMNADESFYHVLLNYGKRNCFLVIVVDCTRETIHGHYWLDLNAVYGLDDDGWPNGEDGKGDSERSI